MTPEAVGSLSEKTGVPYFSLASLVTQARQLDRNGLSRSQIVKAIGNLHPRLMRNLSFDVACNDFPSTCA